MVAGKQLLQLRLERISHPSYFTGTAPSDHYLLRNFQIFLNCKTVINDDGLKSHLFQSLDDKAWKFYDNAIVPEIKQKSLNKVEEIYN